MIKRILERPIYLFALVLAWKIALLIISAQPVPSNDAFFYDGPVVNFLLHGKYANPSLVLALPISGGEVFCAYPPLYQLALLGWLSIFGVSAMAAMGFHLFLFALYLWILLKIFHRLNLTGWPAATASAFLLVITFHDRPDSLAHVFGMLAVYCWIRSRVSLDLESHRLSEGNPQEKGTFNPLKPYLSISWRSRREGWMWATVGFVVLSLATGLQIGALYFIFIWIGMLVTSVAAKEDFPFVPMLMLGLIPAALLGLVIFGFPHLWMGFLEHARQTPSLTGWRVPRFSEVLKALRTVPGVLIVVALMPGWIRERRRVEAAGKQTLWLVTVTCAVSTFAVVAASLFLLTPNSIFFASYLQPLIVGSFLGMIPFLIEQPTAPSIENTPTPVQPRPPALSNRPMHLAALAFLALAGIGSIRAIGMSTWGVACSSDVDYTTAIKRVSMELDGCPRESAIVLSSAYLYEAARHDSKIRSFHSDWLAPARRGGSNTDLQALATLKPCKIILTQFDYFRRFEAVLSQLQKSQDLARFEIMNTAKIRTPDSFPSVQKVVQHISWAPVIVSLSWR